PHHEQRTTRRVSATSTTSFSTRSTTTAITRMRRRCRRTDIASGSIRAPSLLGDFDITEYRGALTLTLALPKASASPTQRAVSKDKNRFAKIRNHFHLHGGAPSPTLPPTLTGETPQRPKRGETLGRDLRIAFGRVGEGPTDRPSGRATASELRQWCGTGSRVLGNGDPAAERLRPATSVATRLGARALPEDRVGMRSPERVGASAPAFSGPSRCWTTRRSCGRHDT